MMKFSIPSVRRIPCASLLSVFEVVNFVQKRCYCLGHENPGLGFQKRRYSFGTLTALEEYGCFENESQYQLLVDSLLVMSLTCLAECYELLGNSANTERINTARAQLQKVGDVCAYVS
ncbi:hypothetical protein EON65_57530 [archaeon]|nr:MAG: hypothetical protein EON65_57530 [archaeon]